MKKLNIFLAVILAILVILVAYFLLGGTLSAAVHSVSAPASEQPEAFQSIQNILAASAAPDQYSSAPESADGCTLIDANITLRNRGLFPAEWVSIHVTPVPGDIAVYSLTGEGTSIPTGGSGQVNLKLITTDAAASRTVELRYYVFGMLRKVRVTV